MHKYQVVEAGTELENASSALILLHGRGGRAESILPLAKEFSLKDTYIVAPQATNNTWYPHSFLYPEIENEPWLSSAIDLIHSLIVDINRKLPTDRIYLMGFSQGACLSLEVSARFATHYGGVVAFSGGLIGEHLETSRYKGDFEQTKVFIGISEKDPHIPLYRVKESQKIFENLHANITVEVYKGDSHSIRRDEISWVRNHLFSYG